MINLSFIAIAQEEAVPEMTISIHPATTKSLAEGLWRMM
jgi:hypothetical protein